MKSIQKKNTIISKYDQTAGKYDRRYRSIQNLKYRSIFEKLENYKTDIILDVGCGTSLLFNVLKNATDFFVGLDISKKMLKIALRKNKRANLHLICADIDFLPFRENVFSSIFSITVLQNLPNPMNSINEVIRVCKWGGITIFTILKKGLDLEQFENMFKNNNSKRIFLFDMKETEDFATIRKKINADVEIRNQ